MQTSRTKKREPRNGGRDRGPQFRAAPRKNGGMGRPVTTEIFSLSGEEANKPLAYRTCGLEGIYLLNGYQIDTYDDEEYLTITDVDGLHKAIGRHLVKNRKALSAAEIRFLRNTMDLTQAELARKLGNNSQSVARWEKGICEIPATSEKLLRAVFLASLMTADELSSLRDFLLSQLQEIDGLDEVNAVDVQFELFGHWTERDKAA
jgi:DNA-binding transcriptional regulator YiaG